MGKAPVELKEIDAVEREVDELRERTQGLIAELEKRIGDGVDRVTHTAESGQLGIARIKHAVDLPAQIHEHPRAATGIGIGTAAAIGLGLYFLFSRRAARRRPLARWKRRAGAYREILANPERALAHERPSLTRRLLAALLVAGATGLVRQIAALAFPVPSSTIAQKSLPSPSY